MRHSNLLAALFALSFLSACGTRGGLQLPPGPPPAPLFGNPAPAKPVQKTDAAAAEPTVAGDTNTATEAPK